MTLEFSILPFSSRWYLCTQKCPHALHPISQNFSQHRLWNGSNVCLTDNGLFLPFQGRLPSSSSFYASLLQAVNGVMSLALCLQVMSQAPQHFRSFEMQATCDRCFCLPVCMLGHFPQLKNNTSTSFFKGERRVSGSEQEHLLSKARVKHNLAWSWNGWVTIMC